MIEALQVENCDLVAELGVGTAGDVSPLPLTIRRMDSLGNGSFSLFREDRMNVFKVICAQIQKFKRVLWSFTREK
ncbi:hypothetical protein [Sulfitobacter geojensis]|uniref:hypothetical protein n=1 Tax=Sulfitobacter geojensis TaxID=1342299 RepID=UPI0007D9233E|nr:hypothetical protein [Sulfitobacter geojensis]OAN92679.1 hypothetical protein A8B74_18070 [Sulfitobacter geojensis]